MKQHKVFISYSSKNIDVANTIYDMLESRQISCWMAPRDLITGEDYGSSIEEAIRTAQIIVFVFSKFGNKSQWVKSELSIAFSEQKLIIPFKIDNTNPEGIVRMVLTKSQWIDALSESNEHYSKLLERVCAALDTTIVNENMKDRILKITESIRRWPVLLSSIAVLLSSKYINTLFHFVNIHFLKETVLQYSEMTFFMTIVFVIASTTICLSLRNEGRKWNKLALATIFIVALVFFSFWEIIRDLRNGDVINFSTDMADLGMLFYLTLVMSMPAIASYFFIVRRIPSAFVFFFFYWTLLFGINIDSPWTIISSVPIIFLYFYTSYIWYKKMSTMVVIILVITISIYIGMNFVNYSSLINNG